MLGAKFQTSGKFHELPRKFIFLHLENAIILCDYTANIQGEAGQSEKGRAGWREEIRANLNEAGLPASYYTYNVCV